MSSPDEIERLGGEVLRKSRTTALRARMESFVRAHEAGGIDFKQLREETQAGVTLSELVDEGRDERV